MSTWREKNIGFTPCFDFTKSVVKLIRLICLKTVDVSMRLISSLFIFPFAHVADYIISISISRFANQFGNNEDISEIHERFGKLCKSMLHLKKKISHLPTGRAIRSYSNVDLECLWLNSVMRISWPVGMCATVERAANGYVVELLKSYNLFKGVQLIHLTLGKSSPMIKSLAVHEGTESHHLVIDIECSWVSDEGEIFFHYSDITGKSYYLRLFELRLEGFMKCTFDSSIASFFPWGRASAQFYEKPYVKFEHETYLGSNSPSTGTLKTAPLTSMVVDTLISLLKSKLKNVALAPRSISFNLSKGFEL